MPTIADRLVACKAVRFGEFTLTSGATSPYYVDVKQAMTEPGTLAAIATEIAQICETQGPFDAVAGMELGAVPLATAVSLASGLPLMMIRKGDRQHGTGKRIEGPPADGKTVLVVEDVTTSGGSTVEAVKVLRDAGAMVAHACVVVDRESGGAQALSAVDVHLHALVRAADLLELAEMDE